MLNMRISSKVVIADILDIDYPGVPIRTICRNEDVLTDDKRQEVYDSLEKLCQSITNDEILQGLKICYFQMSCNNDRFF